MKRVNMRTFLRDIKSIKPPVIVTSWGEEKFVVVPWEDWEEALSHPSDVGRVTDRKLEGEKENL